MIEYLDRVIHEKLEMRGDINVRFVKDWKSKMFDNPQAATDGLREFGTNTEIPVEEPDLESNTAGTVWQELAYNAV